MISLEEARARVARGANHLDRVRPGWFDRIDVGTLTLHDPCGCIVGQLGEGGLGYVMEWHQVFDAFHDGEEYGVFTRVFGEESPAEAYASLQDAWIEAIADRRLATQPTVADLPSAVMVSR